MFIGNCGASAQSTYTEEYSIFWLKRSQCLNCVRASSQYFFILTPFLSLIFSSPFSLLLNAFVLLIDQSLTVPLFNVYTMRWMIERMRFFLHFLYTPWQCCTIGYSLDFVFVRLFGWDSFYFGLSILFHLLLHFEWFCVCVCVSLPCISSFEYFICLRCSWPIGVIHLIVQYPEWEIKNHMQMYDLSIRLVS